MPSSNLRAIRERVLSLAGDAQINVTTDQWTKIDLPGVTATPPKYDAWFTAGDRAVIEVQARGSDGEQL
jgi:hypothetical protein